MEIDSKPERTVNVPLLAKILDHVVAHPEEWNQGYWAQQMPSTTCGTAYCIAGHAVVMAGYNIDWGGDDRSPADRKGVRSSVLDDGRRISAVAAELLGIDPDPSLDLFQGNNSLRDIFREAHRLTDGEITVPDELPDGS